ADFCYISSLEDGMNLVAKEFVAARADQKGVLVVSSFAGAARELKDALIVNPYDIDGSAESLLKAVQMDPYEQTERMARMRNQVAQANSYAWGAQLFGDLASIAERKSGLSTSFEEKV